MHHQVQEFGDFGLEWLGLGRRSGIGGHYLARWMSKESGKTDIATLLRLASFVATAVFKIARQLPPSPTINNR
jgi:hypothetical protein